MHLQVSASAWQSFNFTCVSQHGWLPERKDHPVPGRQHREGGTSRALEAVTRQLWEVRGRVRQPEGHVKMMLEPEETGVEVTVLAISAIESHKEVVHVPMAIGEELVDIATCKNPWSAKLGLWHVPSDICSHSHVFRNMLLTCSDTRYVIYSGICSGILSDKCSDILFL